MRHFETKSVNEFVTLGLVVFYQNRFLGLIGDRFSRPDARPVENIKVVQTALRLQQLSSLDWGLAGNLCSFLDQGELGLLLPKIDDFPGAHQLMFSNVVCDFYTVR